MNSKEAMYAKGRMKRGVMNNTEAAYDAHLRLMERAGEIKWCAFEGMKFRLADGCFYTPDFMVMLADNTLEAHEVKGFWQEDARVKIKVASEMYPVRFIAIKKLSKKNGGGWGIEEF